MNDDRQGQDHFKMRKPCVDCGSEFGTVTPSGNQDIVRCHCGKYQYNAPRSERGLAPTPVRSDGLKPKERYTVEERANFRCEFCGADAATRQMHVGHLLSERDIRTNDLPLEWADHPDNLAWICDACNLGMGARSFTIHHALLWAIKRQMQVST